MRIMELDDILNLDRLHCSPDRADEGWYLDHDAILEAMDKLGIKRHVRIKLHRTKYGGASHYGLRDGTHKLVIPRNVSSEIASFNTWHELAHCMQSERWVDADPRRKLHNWHWDDYKAVDGDWGNRYRGNAYEIEADNIAAENADFHLVVFGT